MIALLLVAMAQAVEPPVLTHVGSVPAQPSKATADCRSGLIRRSFGGQEWHVFACSDQSLTLIARRGSAAYPYMLSIKAVKEHAEVSIGKVFAYRPLPQEMRREMERMNAAAIAELHARSIAAAGR